jgi:hypothetical protein
MSETGYSEKEVGIQEKLETPTDASAYLHELEETGKYLFHGSDKMIAILVPKQPTVFDERFGKNIPDGEPAVCTTSFADIAIFRSLISSNRSKKNGIPHFSSFDIKDGEPVFSTNQESLDLTKRPDICGYVHIFDRKGFGKRDEMEWRSKGEVKPLKIIEVKSKDLPESIKITESLK